MASSLFLKTKVVSFLFGKPCKPMNNIKQWL